GRPDTVTRRGAPQGTGGDGAERGGSCRVPFGAPIRLAKGAHSFPTQDSLDMKHWLHPDMREATRLTRAGRLTEATALLQRLLRSGTEMPAAPGTDGEAADPPAADGPPVIDGEAEVIEPSGEPTAPRPSPDAMRDDPIRLRMPKAQRGSLERNNRTISGAGERRPTQ